MTEAIFDFVRLNFDGDEKITKYLLSEYFRKKGVDEKKIDQQISRTLSYQRPVKWEKLVGKGSWGSPKPIFVEDESKGFFRSTKLGPIWDTTSSFEKCLCKSENISPVSWIIFALCGYSMSGTIDAKVIIFPKRPSDDNEFDLYCGTNGTVIRFFTGTGNPGRFLTQIELCYYAENVWYFPHIEGWENITPFIDLLFDHGCYGCPFDVLDECPSRPLSPGYNLLWSIFMEKWVENQCIFEDDDGKRFKIVFEPGEDLQIFYDEGYEDWCEKTSYDYTMRAAITSQVEYMSTTLEVLNLDGVSLDEPLEVIFPLEATP